MKYALLLPISLLALHSCSTSSSSVPINGDLVSGVLNGDLVDEYAFSSSDPARITVPILKAPDLEAKFGKANYAVMADGSYAARHSIGGGRYFTIVGTSRPAKRFSYDVHGTLVMMGKPNGYYVTGNEDPEITTKPMVLRAPDGKSATYVLIHGGRQGQDDGQSLARDIPRLAW